MTMLAFHGDPKIKAKYLKRVRAHAKADELIKGQGWSNGKGCAIGCTLDGYDHSRYPIELGIPIQIAYLEDHLFEALPVEASQKWPALVLSSITPGADLYSVWPKFAFWLMGEVRPFAKGFPDCEAAIDRVADLFRDGLMPAWAAAGAAWDAARAAAWDAGDAAIKRQAAKLIELLREAK